MKHLFLGATILCALSVSAETLTGHVLQVKDNVAYVKTADGQKVPVLLNDKTYYRRKKVTKKGKESFELYQPLMSRGDNVTLTYDLDTVEPKTGAVRAADVLVVIER